MGNNSNKQGLKRRKSFATAPVSYTLIIYSIFSFSITLKTLSIAQNLQY